MRLVDRLERGVVLAVLGLMVLVVLESAVEVAWLVVRWVFEPPTGLVENGRLLDVFGAILLIVIGLELLASIRAYLRDAVLHLGLVLEIALVALARKAIVLDLEKYDGVTLLGLAAVVLALGFALYLQQRDRGAVAGGRHGEAGGRLPPEP